MVKGKTEKICGICGTKNRIKHSNPQSEIICGICGTNNMDKNIAIEFQGVGKQYRLGRVGTGTLQHDLNRFWQTTILGKEDPYLKIGEVNDRSEKAHSDYVWALKDINFKVEQGDVVGIIGKNGAGKSTLLKLLSHITSPTPGDIYYRGRIASLLEVGTGFHGELTGKENIYMNGAVLGMTKHEIKRKLDDIIEFAGVEKYIDTPVKRYSSGMTVRLGFAVAAFLEPEILVVDEVLTVGDLEFQKRAIGKMDDVAKNGGRTVLFVSHNMASVRQLCKNGIVLKNGQLAYSGTSEDCVNYYAETNISELTGHQIITHKHHTNRNNYLQEIEFKEATLLNDPKEVANNEPIEIIAKVKINSHNITSCQYTISIKDENDVIVAGFLTDNIPIPLNKDYISIKFKINCHGLTKGKYNVDLVAGTKDFSRGFRNYDSVQNVLSFEVKYYDYKGKKDFIVWKKNWGNILHNNELIDYELIS